MSDYGAHGPPVLLHVEVAAKLGQGIMNVISDRGKPILWLLITILPRGKIASAANNGEKCASARTIPLAETNTCNILPCDQGNYYNYYNKPQNKSAKPASK